MRVRTNFVSNLKLLTINLIPLPSSLKFSRLLEAVHILIDKVYFGFPSVMKMRPALPFNKIVNLYSLGFHLLS